MRLYVGKFDIVVTYVAANEITGKSRNDNLFQ